MATDGSSDGEWKEGPDWQPNKEKEIVATSNFDKSAKDPPDHV